jgi:hypothetical protein
MAVAVGVGAMVGCGVVVGVWDDDGAGLAAHPVNNAIITNAKRAKCVWRLGLLRKNVGISS